MVQGSLNLAASLLILLFALPSLAFSQSHVTTLGVESLTAISAVAADGSYALAGFLNAPLVVKLDGTGAVVWRRLIGTGQEVFSGIALLPDGGYVAAGRSQSDAWVVRLDADGQVAWQRAFSGPATVAFSGVAVLANGDLGLVGSTAPFGLADRDLWLVRLNGTGNLLWQRRYGTPSQETGAGVVATADGGLIAVGSTNTTFGAGGGDLLALRVHQNGGLVWQIRLASVVERFPTSVVRTPSDGGMLIGATADGQAGSWLVKLDGNGQVLWHRVLSTDLPPMGLALALGEDGTYLVAVDRAIFRPLTLVRLDALGHVIEQRQFGSHEEFGIPSEGPPVVGASPVPGGGFVVAGGAQHPLRVTFSTRDGWASRVDASGTSACGGQTPGDLAVDPVTTAVSTADLTSASTTATAAITAAPVKDALLGDGRACPGPPTIRSVAVTLTNIGSGQVASQPPGIDCGPACEALFVSGPAITLAATPIAGGAFVRWNGCGGTGPTCLLPSDGLLSHFVGAEFTSPADRLTDLVLEFYDVVLGRVPSEQELGGWLGPLLADSTPGTVGLMAHASFDGHEYRAQPGTLAGYVRALYKTLLGRSPEEEEVLGWTIHLRGLFDRALSAFAGSAEFRTVLPSTQDRPAVEAFITRLWVDVIGRGPAATDVDAGTLYVMTTGDAVGAAESYFHSSEYENQQRSLADHVRALYRAFLARSPVPAEGAPWVDYLIGLRATVEDAVLTSPEFQARFQLLVRPSP